MKSPVQPGAPPPEDCAGEHRAAVYDFVVAYLDDLDAGRKQRLADYLGRFPGHESMIAAEYLHQEELRGECLSAESLSGSLVGEEQALPVLEPGREAEPLRNWFQPVQWHGGDLHPLNRAPCPVAD